MKNWRHPQTSWAVKKLNITRICKNLKISDRKGITPWSSISGSRLLQMRARKEGYFTAHQNQNWIRLWIYMIHLCRILPIRTLSNITINTCLIMKNLFKEYLLLMQQARRESKGWKKLIPNNHCNSKQCMPNRKNFDILEYLIIYLILK